MEFRGTAFQSIWFNGVRECVVAVAGRGVLTRHQLDGGMGAPLNRGMGLWMEVWVPTGLK